MRIVGDRWDSKNTVNKIGVAFVTRGSSSGVDHHLFISFVDNDFGRFHIGIRLEACRMSPKVLLGSPNRKAGTGRLFGHRM